MKIGKIFLATQVAVLFAGTSAFAGDLAKMPVADVVESDPFSICDIFDYATLYEDDEAAILQKFALTGRLQADAAFFDANQADDSYERLLWRRFRFGFKAKVLQHVTIHSEADLELNRRDPLYGRLTDTNIAWSKSDAFQLKIGKQGAAFTLDGATSSKKILRMERNLLSSNLWFPLEYFTGVTASGEIGNWIYNVGAFSSDRGPEFGDFQSGGFGLVSLGYDFGEQLGIDRALIRADYVNNNPSGEGNLGTRSLYQIGSINGHFENGDWGLWTDIAAAEGYAGQSDLFALAVMPFYNLTEKVQLVASYNFVTSSGDNGVRLDRYENRVERGRSNEAHEFYAGVNYYLCGHKLKWQTGVEYTTTSDDANDGGAYDGWGATTGIRISW